MLAGLLAALALALGIAAGAHATTAADAQYLSDLHSQGIFGPHYPDDSGLVGVGHAVCTDIDSTLGKYRPLAEAIRIQVYNRQNGSPVTSLNDYGAGYPNALSWLPRRRS